MQARHETNSLTRRHALALAGAIGMLPFGRAGAAAEAPLIAREIPSTGERLPVLGLGTDDYFTDSAPSRAALSAVLNTLVTGGASIVDTASDYGDSEKMLGAVIAQAGSRARLFIATKLETDELSKTGVQGSLQRLGVSKIDLMQVHNVRSAGQSLAALRDWKAQGLIRYVGITTSETSQHDVLEAVMRHEKPDFIQLNYSMRDREAENRLLPAAAQSGVAALINLPLGRSSLFRAVQGKTLPEWAREFDAATWGQFFLKYVLGNEAVTAAIPGTRNPEHMADNLGAGRGRLPNAAQRQRMVQYFEAL
ncbi:MAG: aldo/keto reductase [Alphaproteobacteria bacterium]|nr:aldo/keto reductase [Alphaproteobacteria bacterium]